jgi:Family of unknown function (DUF5709)
VTIDSTHGWYVEDDGAVVADEDEANYDEAVGPTGPHDEPGRLVEEDEGVRSDTEPDAVAYQSGDHSDLTAEEAAIHVIKD